MAEKQTLNSSPLELAIQRELAYRKKVPCPKHVVITTQTQTPSFKKWTYTGSVSNASALGYLAFGEEPNSPKVHSSAKTPRLPSSSPRPQNRMGQSLIKDEPYSSELSNEKSHSHNPSCAPPLVPLSSQKPILERITPSPRPGPKPDLTQGTNMARFQTRSPNPISNTSGRQSPTSALNDWVGPSKLPDDKFRSRNSAHKAPHLVPIHSENPILERKIPPPRPSSKPDPIQGTNTARFHPRSPNPNSFQRPSVPTNPRSGLKRKETENEQLTNKKSVDSLLCELCQASCSSARTMQQHLKGRPHKAKLEWMKLKRDSGGPAYNKPMCNVCKIWCSDRNSLEMHIKGQKHKAKLEELEIRKRKGAIDKKPILCELCGVYSMNGSFKMHLKGKQHAVRQELRRRGML